MMPALQIAWTQLATIGAADWLAIVSGAAYALLAVQRSRWCWLAGAVSSLALIYVAFRSALPMQGALQAFYVAMSIYGFWRWSRSGEEKSIRISVMRLPWHVGFIAAGVLLSSLAGGWLAQYTQSAWPLLDTLVMLGSLLATWMTAQGKLENWLYWIVIDAASVFLYYAQAASGAALLYLLYIAIAIGGLVTWTRQYRTQQAL